jgi:hypothetical protein
MVTALPWTPRLCLKNGVTEKIHENDDQRAIKLANGVDSLEDNEISEHMPLYYIGSGPLQHRFDHSDNQQRRISIALSVRTDRYEMDDFDTIHIGSLGVFSLVDCGIVSLLTLAP